MSAKVKVPEGMQEAIGDAIKPFLNLSYPYGVAKIACEVALLWQRENARKLLTDEVIRRVAEICSVTPPPNLNGDATRTRFAAILRVIYGEPEPEVPPEIADLLKPWPCEHNKPIIEAFRRGQKAGK
jgi:hypothetical protein